MNRTESASKRSTNVISGTPEHADRGGMYVAGVKRMARGLGGEPVRCTIVGFYRSSVFEYPKWHLSEEIATNHRLLSDAWPKAAVVTDLPAFFTRSTPEASPHYEIDVSLRARVHEAYSQTVNPARV